MKKKTLSLLLAVTMMMNFIVPAMAVVSADHEMILAGSEAENFYNDVNGITFDLKLRAPQVGSTASVLLKIDASKFRFVSYSLESDSSVTGDIPVTAVDATTTLTDESWNPMYGNAPGFISAVTFIGGKSADGSVLYLGIQPEFKANVTTLNTTATTVCSFRLAFQPGVNETNLDITSVQVLTATETDKIGQSEAAVIPNGEGDDYVYAPVDTMVEARLAKPTITYPNSDVINLNGVKADAVNRYVNVPVSLPTAGADVPVQASAKGYYTSDCADGTEIESGVTYKYSVAMKDGSVLPDTVSINEDTGLLTIKAGAPAAVVTITATGTYTNSKNVESTASGTFDVELCHGDAGAKEDADKTEPEKEPGGEPDDPDDKTLKGVIIYQKNGETQVQVATSADTVPYEYAVAIPKTEATKVEFVGKAVDAFGDVVTSVTAAWSTTGFDGKTDPTFSEGTMTVGTGAAKGNYTMTYTADTMHADVKVTVDTTAVHWPTLSSNTLTYGEKLSKLEPNNDGSFIGDDGNPVDGVTFTWKNKDAQPAVSDTTAVMVVNGTGLEETPEKTYPITVNKAKLKIAIDSTLELEGTTLEIPVGETVNLNPVLENASVQDENGKNLVVTGKTINAALTNPNGTGADALVTQSNFEFTGVRQSDDPADVANVTLSVPDINDNNYEAPDNVGIELYVAKPVLKATIGFDTTAPVYGQKITATVTEHANQSGSLTTDVTYQWGHVTVDAESGKITAFAALGGDNQVQNIVPNGDGTATVEYTPVLTDIGQTLGLKVITPTDLESYGWIHSVQDKMAAPVARATWGTISGSVKSVTTTSVTVKGEKDAWFAIALKNAPVTAAEGELEEPVADGHTWVQSVDGADVTFTTDDTNSALAPNTEYTVFMKKEADGYETATTSFDTKTAKESITPQPNPDPDNPTPIPPTITGVTVTAAIDETAGLKFGQTLTASVEVTDTLPHDPVITIAADQWEYNWYRVTPAEGENPETEELITEGETTDAHTGDTYTLAQADIGKVIRVKAKTKDTCDYIAYADVDTSDKIAKADGPEFTNTLGADKASSADATDGAITGLTAETEYEYIVKPVKAEGESEEPTPDWTNATKATANTEGKITGLGVNTYLIRIPATATQNASEHQEIKVDVNGFNITGKIKSYNSLKAATYKLYTWDGTTYYKWSFPDKGYKDLTPVATGTLVEALSESGTVAAEQAFTIPNVVDGTYMLVVEKPGHLSYTVYNVVVNGGDLDLTADTRDEVKVITLCAGDVNGDGRVTVADKNVITNTNNYGKDFETMPNPEADLNGDIKVTVADKNIVTNANAYGKTVESFVAK